MANTEGLNVREGKTYLDVNSKKGVVSFAAPAFGPGTYANVGSQISKARLEQPTMAQNAELVDAAWQNPKEKYSSDIISTLRNNWLWGFNGLLYVPNEGIYVQDRPEVRDGRVYMDYNNVSEKLGVKDPSVRFVAFDEFKGESQTSLELSRNRFVQALAGEEGAYKLAKVADKYNSKPYVWALKEKDVSQLTTKVASLDSGGIGDGRLVVGGGWDGSDDVIGCAFGVRSN